MKIKNMENEFNRLMWPSMPTIKTNRMRVMDDYCTYNLCNKGITLMALIITIILMLILAGVVLSLTIGENGIFKTVKYVVQKNSEEVAREKLELALENLQANKYTDQKYNENEYIDEYLEYENMKVADNVVTVDGWKFEINRDNLKIGKSLGKANTKIIQEIKEYIGKNANDKYEVNMLVTIESNNPIESITFQNSDGTMFEIKPTENRQKISKDITVELDEEYVITVKNANGDIETIKVREKSVEKIRTAEELAEFRDKVNMGLSYEGKTIEVVNNIDLSSVCGENVNGKEISWDPIGNYRDDEIYFSGIFNGNYNTISNLYINSSENFSTGLFVINCGTIENLIMDNVYINVNQNDSEYASNTSSSIGIIAGTNSGEIKNVGINSGNIINTNTVKPKINYRKQNVGGIVGSSSGSIYECYNKANMQVTTSTYYSSNIHPENVVGGIAGQIQGVVSNCYNIGSVEIYNANTNRGGGILGMITKDNADCLATVSNCYNIGKILGKKNSNTSGKNYISGIIGTNGYNSNNIGKIINSYCSDESASCSYYIGYNGSKSNSGRVEKETLQNYTEALGNEFANDIKIKIKDEKTGEEKQEWKYNNGYPILKWQLDNN